MSWNEKHINEIRYPHLPDLEQALSNFRQQYTWYEQQMKYKKKGQVDVLSITDAWNNYLKIRNQYVCPINPRKN